MSDSPSRWQCKQCVHYNVTPAIEPFSPEDLKSPGVLKALREWQENQKQRQRSEKTLFDERKPFPLQPNFYAWCGHHTARISHGYVICSHQNPNNTCPDFMPQPGAATTPALLPRSSMASPAPAPDVRPYESAPAAARQPDEAAPSPAVRTDGTTAWAPIKPPSVVTIPQLQPVTDLVHVGHKLELITQPQNTRNEPAYTLDQIVNGVLPEWERLSAINGDGVPTTQMVNVLEPIANVCPKCGTNNRPTARFCLVCRDKTLWTPLTNGNLFISDKGLTTSYGIFGAPGYGKTHLFLHMLEQILRLHKDDLRRRCGGLILDPKAALVDKVSAMMERAGRFKDLTILNTEELTKKKPINVIDSTFRARDLAKLLVLAARSAGVAGADDFWFGEWTTVFAAAIMLLQEAEKRPLTLRRLLEALFYEANLSPLRQDATLSNSSPARPPREIEQIAADLKSTQSGLLKPHERNLRWAIERIERFYGADYAPTVLSFIDQGYGAFLLAELDCYSPDPKKPAEEPRQFSFYDEIIEEGKVVLVSISPGEPELAKTLCTLVKCMFQQTVLGRVSRAQSGDRRSNFERQLLLACDEYSLIASEIPGQIGDGYFFSQCREAKCMGLLATQSVNVLQASSLKENWRSVFSNFGAKIFMHLEDNETIKEAVELVGGSEWLVDSAGSSSSNMGLGTSNQRSLQERQIVTAGLLRKLTLGQALVIGSTDGGKTTGGDAKIPGIHFIQVPAGNQR